MVKRKKSMLEAFNTAGGITPPKPLQPSVPTPKTTPLATPAPTPQVPVNPAQPMVQDGILTPAPKPGAQAANSGGPFAEPTAAGPEAAGAQPNATSAQEASQGLRAPSSALVWVLLGLIIVSFSFAAWYGKQQDQAGTLGDTQSEASNGAGATDSASLGGFAPSAGAQPRPSGNSIGTSGGPAPVQAARAIAPLQDPANKYTVVAITYGKSHMDLASAMRDFLRDMGLPVNPILRVKNNLLVSVGAKPSRDELVKLEARIHKLTYNGERGALSGAYVDAISKYLDR